MHRSRWLALPMILLLAACGSTDQGPPAFSVTGTWSAPMTLSACTALDAVGTLSFEQVDDELTGYLLVASTTPGDFELYGAFEGRVTAAGKVTGAVRFTPGLLGNGNLTADIRVVDDQLVGTITSDAPEHCGTEAPKHVKMLIDFPRTAATFTEPTPTPDISGTWTDVATSTNECGVISAVAVTLQLEQGPYGVLQGQAELVTDADLPRYTLLSGYLVPQGFGQLQIEAGDWGGDVLLELRDDGVLEARFQYSPFDCGGVPHAKVVVAALSR